MSRQSELAQLGRVFDTGPLSNRNLIINGAMTVAQRGTSVTEINNSDDGYQTTDRWKVIGTGTSGKVNMSQESDAPDGFEKSTKFACHTADTSILAGDAWRVETHLEAQDLRHLNYGVGSTTAKKVTLSFWVKSNLTGTWAVGLYMDSTTGGDTTKKENSQSYTINAANTWEYKTLTFSPNTLTNMNSTDNDHGLRVWFHMVAGSDFTSGTADTWGASANRAIGHNVNLLSSTSNNWYFTGVQLEVGDTATPFEHRSYGDELARCQRYTFIISGAGYTPKTSGAYQRFPMHGNGTDTALWYPDFPVTMRADPSLITSNFTSSTVEVYNYSTGNTAGFTSVALAEGGKTSEQVTFTLPSASDVASGHIVTWRWNNSPAAYIGFDAEL